MHEVAGESAPGVEHRRRGSTLEDAICHAAFAELAETGYAGFTIDSVAARARTGKASIYRRWPTKDKLIMDAFCREAPSPAGCLMAEEIDDSVTTRDALLRVAKLIVSSASGEHAAGVRSIAAMAARDPAFARAVDREVLTPRREGLVQLFRRGIARGEVHPDAAIELIAEMLPAFVMARTLLRHVPVTAEVMVAVVDDLVLPLLSRPAATSCAALRGHPSGGSESAVEQHLRDVAIGGAARVVPALAVE